MTWPQAVVVLTVIGVIGTLCGLQMYLSYLRRLVVHAQPSGLLWRPEIDERSHAREVLYLVQRWLDTSDYLAHDDTYAKVESLIADLREAVEQLKEVKF